MRARLFVLVASLLATTGLLSQTAHMTLVSHAVCAAHGELIHDAAASMPHVDGSVSFHEAGLTSHDPGRVRDAVASDDERVEHDHCDALATDDLLIQPSQALEVMAPEWLVLVSRAPDGERVVRERLFLLAPKTSPPA